MCSYVHVEGDTISSYAPPCPLAGINQWASTLLHGEVDDKGEKVSFKKGAEDGPRNSLLFRSHRAPGEGRSISEEAIARRLSGGVVGRRDRGVESLASTRCVIANSVFGAEGIGGAHSGALFVARTLAVSHTMSAPSQHPALDRF